jgi:tetratricopeptide (TPR) repeat protein
MRPIGTRSRRLFLATLGVLIGIAGLGWAWPRLFPDPLAGGRTAYARHDWATASARALRRLRENPGDREALRLLARSEGRLGRDDAAQATYGRLGLDAMQAEDFVVVAGGLVRRRRPDQARRALEMGLEREPDYAEALHELARIDAATGRPSEASVLAERLAARPGWEARGALMLGLLRHELGDPRGAAEALGRALRLRPGLEGLSSSPRPVRRILARSLLQAGDRARARVLLGELLAGGPDPEASWLLSRAMLIERDLAGASAALAASQGYGDRDPTAPEPAPYVGSVRCADCHATIYRAQQSSRHSRTFRRASEPRALPEVLGPIADPRDRRVVHMVRRTAEGLQWEARDRDRAFTALVDYVFGSRDIGATPVGRDARGQARELRLSHYGRGSVWDVTTGQADHPTAPDEFLGKPLSRDALRQCLGCHVTNARDTSERDGPTAVDRGIGCERCHGPGGHHLAAIAASFPDPAIARPRLATADRVVALCAGCHSPRGEPPRPGDPAAARFAGTALPRSRCFTASAGTLSCITCHDPHRDAETSAAAYEARCLDCHARPAGPSGPTRVSTPPRATLAAEVRRVACPVDPLRGCVGCHMPTISGIVPHATFTDHHIRVLREGADTRADRRARSTP